MASQEDMNAFSSQARGGGDDAIGTTEIDGVYTFLSHVDWSERWLQGVIVFHVLCLVLTILTRFNTSLQAFLFVALLAIVFFAENINEYAAMNYKYFSRLQYFYSGGLFISLVLCLPILINCFIMLYFDSGGLFISLVLCVPILINCFIMLIFWLFGAGKMLVKVKRAKLIRRARQDAARTGEGEGDDTENKDTSKTTPDVTTDETKKSK